MVKRGSSELYILTPEQVNSTLRTCESITDRIVIKGPLYLGLRVGELVHLRAEWILGDKEISIPASMWCSCSQCSKNTKHPGEWTPKYKASQRRIVIADRVRDDLLTFLTANPNGLGMSRFTIDRHSKRIMKRAGVKFPGRGGGTSFPHALRATCATMLASAGLNEAQLCSFMGWNSLKSAEPYIRLASAREGTHEAVERAFGTH